jgi:opacity protein-like surface antigen
MRRMLSILAAAVVLVVLVAATASPAFAANNNKGNGWQCESNCGYCGTGQNGPDNWKGKCTAQR